MGIWDYKHLLVNLIIAMEGALLLTDGAHRQRFYSIYSECNSRIIKSLGANRKIKNLESS